MDIFKSVGDGLLQVVLPILGTAIAGYIVAGLSRLFKRQGIELDAAQQQAIKDLVIAKIKAAEEAARRRPGGMTGIQKTTMVESAVMAKDANITREAVRDLIDEALPDVRASLEPAVIVPLPDSTNG